MKLHPKKLPSWHHPNNVPSIRIHHPCDFGRVDDFWKSSTQSRRSRFQIWVIQEMCQMPVPQHPDSGPSLPPSLTDHSCALLQILSESFRACASISRLYPPLYRNWLPWPLYWNWVPPKSSINCLPHYIGIVFCMLPGTLGELPRILREFPEILWGWPHFSLYLMSDWKPHYINFYPI